MSYIPFIVEDATMTYIPFSVVETMHRDRLAQVASSAESYVENPASFPREEERPDPLGIALMRLLAVVRRTGADRLGALKGARSTSVVRSPVPTTELRRPVQEDDLAA